MDNKNLGRLTKIDNIRDIWPDEARDFTPWLAQENNIRLLGDTIGIELEVETQEKDVGPYSADILCKDTVNNHWVLIENQLEKTNHTHLGQLMTYAAGLDAVSIVWIAQRFTEEHRAALDWLNSITEENINFFGLEIELWQIGDSAIAPKFNIISKPNDWSKTVKDTAEKGGLSETQKLQLEFWKSFKEFMDQNSKLKCTSPKSKYYMQHPIGHSGFHLTSIASAWDSQTNQYTWELRACFVVDGKTSKERFAILEADQTNIEKEIGEEVFWYNPDNAKVCRIILRKPHDLTNRESWEEAYKWLKEKLEILYDVFYKRVQKIHHTFHQNDEE